MIDRSSSATVLASLLQDLRPVRASYGRLDLRGPWGIDLPFQDGVRFHMVVDGECTLSAPGHLPINLAAGDIALLPHGSAHEIADRSGSELMSLADLDGEEVGERVYSLRKVSDGKAALLICCTVGFDASFARRLLRQMPAVMIVRREDAAVDGLRGIAELMAEEARRQRIGMATLLPRLADIVVTWVIRHWAETTATQSSGWLAALQSPGLGNALVAMHVEPARRWTTATLAKTAGMSRSAFAARFLEQLGQPPGQYLLESRIAMANNRLRKPGTTIADAAEGAGYGSEAAFTRAFKRVTGVTPGQVRKLRSHQKQ